MFPISLRDASQLIIRLVSVDIIRATFGSWGLVFTLAPGFSERDLGRPVSVPHDPGIRPSAAVCPEDRTPLCRSR